MPAVVSELSQAARGSPMALMPCCHTGLSAHPENAAIQAQLVEVKFRAPKAGKYNLTLYCIQLDTPKNTPQFF